MKPNDAFQFFANSDSRRRWVKVANLSRREVGYQWSAVLVDAYLVIDGADVPIASFKELFGAFGEAASPELLQKIRKSGQLTEGSQWLTTEIINCLVAHGAESAFVRPVGEDKVTIVTPQQLATNIFSGVGATAEGEIEICDSSQGWYLRARDDEPISFLYARRELLREIEHLSPDSVLSLPNDFHYAD